MGRERREMKSTYVDPKTGDVVCPVCGARNQFTAKRTAKAKWMAVPTIGVGVLAMPKRLSCNGCGTNLKRGGMTNAPRAGAKSVKQARQAAPTRSSVERPDRSMRRNCPECGRSMMVYEDTCPFLPGDFSAARRTRGILVEREDTRRVALVRPPYEEVASVQDRWHACTSGDASGRSVRGWRRGGCGAKFAYCLRGAAVTRVRIAD